MHATKRAILSENVGLHCQLSREMDSHHSLSRQGGVTENMVQPAGNRLYLLGNVMCLTESLTGEI